MDFVNKLTGSNNNNQGQSTQNSSSNPSQQQGGGNNNSGGGVLGSINSALGGGQQGEQNEDYLDKSVDFVQERLGQGPQNNESALEQAKDEKISDAIRTGYSKLTGSEIPIQDKS